MKPAVKSVITQLKSCGLDRSEFSVQMQRDGEVFIALFGPLSRKLELAPTLAEHFYVGIGERNGEPETMIVMTPGVRYPVPNVPLTYTAGIDRWEVRSDL